MDILYSGHLTGQNVAVRIKFALCKFNPLSEMSTPFYFVKWTSFAVPLAPRL